jgi:hypothetical protein
MASWTSISIKFAPHPGSSKAPAEQGFSTVAATGTGPSLANGKSIYGAKDRAFQFEKRAASRPKPIAQVKLEQDLEMKRRKEAAEYAVRFTANQVCYFSYSGV